LPSPAQAGTILGRYGLLLDRSASLPQPHRLQRLAAFDVICQGAAHLSHKSPLILRITQGSRSEQRRPSD
jgi:hypothetical protein